MGVPRQSIKRVDRGDRGGKGYESKSDARDTLEEVMGGEYDGPIEEV